MGEAIKAVTISGVMGAIAHIGGRKTDKYFIFLTGAAYAGIELILAGIAFGEQVANSPFAKGTAKFFEFISAFGGK